MKQRTKDFILKLYPLPHMLRYIQRKRLRNSDFTIFSSNCLGGIIYHLLGIKFLSPTVNLRIDSKDFMKFMTKIHHYLSLPMDFYDDAETPYPLGKLEDITVHFNHYHTREEAVVKWEDRKKRINWDNVYILTNDLDGVTKEDLQKLESVPCKSLLVLTSKDYPDLPFTRNIGSEERLRAIMNKSLVTGLYDFEKWFDYVKFVNTNAK